MTTATDSVQLGTAAVTAVRAWAEAVTGEYGAEAPANVDHLTALLTALTPAVDSLTDTADAMAEDPDNAAEWDPLAERLAELQTILAETALRP